MSAIPSFLTGQKRFLICWTLCTAALCLIVVKLWSRSALMEIVWKYHESTIHTETETEGSNQDSSDYYLWEEEYAQRVETMRKVCQTDDVAKMIPSSRETTYWSSDTTDCVNNICPIIQLKDVLFCFIPKVASTNLKKFFLNVSNVPVHENLLKYGNPFHNYANTVLSRISLLHFTLTTVERAFKIMFVRHPFDRLVSAFRNKAEAPRRKVRYFYEKYFDETMRKLRGNESVDEESKITFQEFVWYLVNTPVRNYDEHWEPYWNRCDPCVVDYDFIGKIETAERDFPYIFRKVGIESSDSWWTKSNSGSRQLTLKYFAQIKREHLLKLIENYRVDMEMFGYSTDDFVDTSLIDEH